MPTVWVAANEEKCHSFLASSSCLEKHSFTMIALNTANSLGARKSWICSYILQHLSPLSNRVVNLISVDTEVISCLLVIAIAASVEENLLLSVFLRVQNVVTFTAKLHGTHLVLLEEEEEDLTHTLFPAAFFSSFLCSVWCDFHHSSHLLLWSFHYFLQLYVTFKPSKLN